MLPSIRSRDIILLYHRVARVNNDPWSLSVTPEHFAEHLEVLRRYKRVRLDHIAPSPKWFGGKPSVAITFDDGYSDNFHEAAKLLRRFETPATFFIATGYVGESREFWWDELERVAGNSYLALYEKLQPMRHDARRSLMNGMFEAAGEAPLGRAGNLPMAAEQITALGRESLFEIGAHTVTHPLLAAQSPETQFGEIQQSKRWLEALLEYPVTSFSYPYGGQQHYNETSVHCVRSAGFERACTTASRRLSERDSPYEWPRVVVTDMDGDQFGKFLSTH
jgi:peptidoglycan/xylan/chitin deacetylase (PgdA/CDA1 family)